MKHTDLPWKIDDDTLIYALNEKGNNIFCCKVMPGCKCGCITASQKELEANAHLIAAAPDLLEALKQAEVEVNKWHSLNVADNDKQNAINAWGCLKKIQKAISKAVAK